MIDRRTIFSKDRQYRYTLWRDWSATQTLDLLSQNPTRIRARDAYVQFIGLNPSTADEVQNDRTITRCINFAKAWGFGALCMTNLFAYRTKDPSIMKKQANPIGEWFIAARTRQEWNDEHLVNIARSAGMVVAAWGNHGDHLTRAYDVRTLLARNRIKLHCLRLTGKQNPEHPLYLPANTQPIEWKL